MPTAEELQAQANAILWFHSIDLGQGVKTKGLSELALGPELLPDFAGKTVLDIGAWDGYYSYMAERAGASRVVALDHYAWGVDFGARGAYWSECFANGTLPDHSRDTTDFWRPDLPGRRGFEFAHQVLDSKVEPVLADFTTVDLDELGTFDVVIYLGVLYHMKEPLTCLERLYQVTNEVAVIETEAIEVRGLEQVSLLQFHPGGDLGADFGNWYVPTTEALVALCRAAGFSKVEVKVAGPEKTRRSKQAPITSFRAVVHAYR